MGIGADCMEARYPFGLILPIKHERFKDEPQEPFKLLSHAN